MIFPGMDPYLENPQLWPEVHSSLIVYFRDALQPLLRPRYAATIEERLFVEGPDHQIIPDVSVKRTSRRESDGGVAVAKADAPVLVEAPDLEVHQPYVQILDLQSGQQVVTVLEVVSPSNKFAGPGRDSYQAKQREVRASTAHLVEIDLLRAGPHVLAVPEWTARGRFDYDYLICVNRADPPRFRFELYPRTLRQHLPKINIPLAGDDPDVPLDLQAVLARVREAGAYDDRINYQAPCQPPLCEEDQAWANELIQAHANRSKA